MTSLLTMKEGQGFLGGSILLILPSFSKYNVRQIYLGHLDLESRASNRRNDRVVISLYPNSITLTAPIVLSA
jgi:hypothetical protein